MRKMKKRLDVPPVWGILALALVFLVNTIFPTPNFGAYLKDWIGVLVIIYGVVFIVLAIKTFRNSETPIFPNKSPTEFLQTGVFSVSRNPIYAGIILINFGVAIILGSMWGFVPVIGLYFILVRRFVLPEEALLIESFGAKAEEYFQNTRRW